MESQAHNNNNKGVPPAGIVYLTKIRRKEFTIGFHKGLILLITFVSYALFHASRKAPSIVKSAWDPQESNTVATNGTAHFSLFPSRKDVRAVIIINTGFVSDIAAFTNPNFSFAERPSDDILSNVGGFESRDLNSTHLSKAQLDLDFTGNSNSSSSSRNGHASFLLEAHNNTAQVQDHDGLPTPPPSTPSGWAPFAGSTGKDKLGEFDFAFLVFYAVGMFFAGHLGDRVDLRWFLSVGMVGSGVFACLIGMAYWWDIHILTFYIMVQMAAGLFQATGWPSVVAVVGNWFGKSKRGLIMGIWNAHTSTGNILGSLIAAAVLQYGWGWSFVLPGLLLVLGGVMVFFFLVVEPADIGFESPYETTTHIAEGENL
jgi:hypothetical protein